MFSQQLESLIEASLADGVLEEKEKIALVKRATAEGVDITELEIYIDSIIQKKIQNERVESHKVFKAHEKERKGNVCPHCSTPIPPLTKICPNCGHAVNSNETSGDKELFKLIDDLTKQIAIVKATNDSFSFNEAKAESERLLKKADLFYGDNKKIQMLKVDVEEELLIASKKFKRDQVINKCIPLLLVLLLVAFAVSLCFIPFFSNGFCAALSKQWNKVFG